ncbi:helix-turn-helix domain-containing protein [Nocardia amamiensis]|uniref:helix-turn-helix domain-containing protein n=1 Tax=Nocardia amamiensis TaxID=404578 RepID=UPI0033FEAA32
MPEITRRPQDHETGRDRWPYHDIAPGLVGYEWLEVSSAKDDGYPYDITATVEPQDSRYVVTKMVVSQRPGGLPLRRGELAKISVDPFVRVAAAEVSRVIDPDDPMAVQPIASVLDPTTEERIRADGISDEDLPRIAAWYRWIRLQDGAPTAVIAEEFGISRATVKRWIAKAVEAGHLTQDERKK